MKFDELPYALAFSGLASVVTMGLTGIAVGTAQAALPPHGSFYPLGFNLNWLFHATTGNTISGIFSCYCYAFKLRTSQSWRVAVLN
jgi:hypothetical protein